MQLIEETVKTRIKVVLAKTERLNHHALKEVLEQVAWVETVEPWAYCIVLTCPAIVYSGQWVEDKKLDRAAKIEAILVSGQPPVKRER